MPQAAAISGVKAAKGVWGRAGARAAMTKIIASKPVASSERDKRARCQSERLVDDSSKTDFTKKAPNTDDGAWKPSLFELYCADR